LKRPEWFVLSEKIPPDKTPLLVRTKVAMLEFEVSYDLPNKVFKTATYKHIIPKTAVDTWRLK
jgi:hypothetical protein